MVLRCNSWLHFLELLLHLRCSIVMRNVLKGYYVDVSARVIDGSPWLYVWLFKDRDAAKSLHNSSHHSPTINVHISKYIVHISGRQSNRWFSPVTPDCTSPAMYSLPNLFLICAYTSPGIEYLRSSHMYTCISGTQRFLTTCIHFPRTNISQ